MEINQFCVRLKAHDFEATTRFYGEVLALPRLRNWDQDNGRGAVYQAGTSAIEVLGRPRNASENGFDEAFDYVGPDHKLTLTLWVPSAEQTYEELLYRDRNIPGGLRTDSDGSLLFATHDPDGVHVIFRESG